MNFLYKRWVFFVVSLVSSFFGELLPAKVLVMTHAYNKPDLIYWQHASFKKFLKDDYQLIVFNDAADPTVSSQIQSICQALDITCMDVPQIIHYYKDPYLPGSRNPLGDPSAECADTIQYMLDTIGFDYPGIVMLVDSDMFLIRELSVENYLKGYNLASNPQVREGRHGEVIYLLPNLILFDMEQLPDKKSLNFNLGIIDEVAVDTGGYTYYYLQEHSDVKWLQTNCIKKPLYENLSILDPKVLNHFKSFKKMYQLMNEMKYDYEFYMDYAFMHFRAGSNWYGMDPETRADKIKVFYGALEQLLEGDAQSCIYPAS